MVFAIHWHELFSPIYNTSFFSANLGPVQSIGSSELMRKGRIHSWKGFQGNYRPLPYPSGNIWWIPTRCLVSKAPLCHLLTVCSWASYLASGSLNFLLSWMAMIISMMTVTQSIKRNINQFTYSDYFLKNKINFIYFKNLSPCCLLCWVVVAACGEWGLLSRWGEWASRCSGFTCCWAWTLGTWAFSGFGLWAQKRLHVGSRACSL